MKEKETVCVNLTGCKYYMELHARIRDAFDFPEGYGMNWHAFWDFLNTECPSDRVVVIGAETMPAELEKSLAMMKHYLEDLRQRRERMNAPFSYEFITAEQANEAE